MIAYEKKYLDNARTHMAEMFDYALNVLKYDEEIFTGLFLKSTIVRDYQRGDFTSIEDKDGRKLVSIMLNDNDIHTSDTGDTAYNTASAEYWTGMILAEYQWKTSRSFKSILDNISLEEIRGAFPLFSRVSSSQFFDRMDVLLKGTVQDTNLKIRREAAGLTQAQLSEQAHVKIRSIQMYEQRKNDIDKAQANYLFRISKILGCSIEDLLEHPTVVTERNLKEA